MANDKLENLFEEFLLMYKVVNRRNIIEILQRELNTEQLIEIYQKSDGEKSTREVAAVLKNKCSHSTIARLKNRYLTTEQRKKMYDLFDGTKSLKEIGEEVNTSSEAVRLFAVSLEKAGLIEYVSNTKAKCPKRLF